MKVPRKAIAKARAAKRKQSDDRKPGAKKFLPPDSAQNRFYIGDCLPVLSKMAEKHGAFVDLVYLDPPFNSKRLYNHAFGNLKVSLPQKIAFHDTWKWTDATLADFGEFQKRAGNTRGGRFLAAMKSLLEDGGAHEQSTLAYLTYMVPRLAMIRAVMKPTAGIFLHCDPNAGHYLKLGMDALFGRANFRNDIVWKRYRGRRSGATRKFPAVVDNILFYAPAGGTFHLPFFPLRPAYVDRVYIHDDDDGKGPYRFGGRIRGRKYYLRDSRGIPATSLWDDIPELNGRDKEMLGYDTQKPVALLRRILESASDPGDLVLDPFCGCGTTIAACHLTGRRFIGVDIARSAAQVINRRMKRQHGQKIVIGGRAPSTMRGWGRLLRDDIPESPDWARFQYDAIAAIPKAEQVEGAIQGRAKLGADGGVDGLIHLRHPKTRAITSVVIQVKRKKYLSAQDVGETLLAVENNNAYMGLLISFAAPGEEVKKRVAGIKPPQDFYGRSFRNRVVVLTYEQVKAGEYARAIPYEFALEPEAGKQDGLPLGGDKKKRK